MTPFSRILPFSTLRRSPGPSSTSLPTAFGGPSTDPRGIPAPGRGAARKSRRGSRPSLELVEERTMMSNIPVFETLNVANGSMPTVQVAPMEQTVVKGGFSPWAQSDRVQVHLQAGEIFTAGLNVIYPAIGANFGSSLEVYGPGGGQVAAQSTSFYYQPGTDPVTGVGTYDDNVSFRAPTGGTYTVEVDENGTYAAYFGQGSYNLTLRPIELDTSPLNPESNPQDAQELQFSGGALYAFLDASKDTLTFAGPTGRGFSIDGQFSETTTPVPGSSFTTSMILSSGPLTLETALGNISWTGPTFFDLGVTTSANGYGGLFGEVSTAQIVFPGSSVVGDILSPFGTLLGPQVQQANSYLSQIGASAGLPGIDVGIGLGSQVNTLMPGAPVNAAVPYLYLDARSGASFGVGQASVSLINYEANIVVDPADASLYAHVAGLPGVSDYALGISEHGYIPFTPTAAPSHFAGKTLFGDLYTNVTIELADLTEDLVPISITQNVVVNVDTTGGSWTGSIQQKAQNLLNGNFWGAFADPSTFAFGVNYSGGLSFSLEEVASVSFPMGGGSLIYNGPTHEIDLAGGTTNPFAGTAVSFLGGNGTSFSVDGYVQTDTGQFDFGLNGGFSLWGYQIAGASLDVNNSGIGASGSTNFLGVQTDVNGWIGFDGSAELWGTASVAEYLDLTWDGWGFVVDFGVNVSFVMDDGAISVWANGWTADELWLAGNEACSYSGNFSYYTYTDLGSFNVWSLVSAAESYV